MGKFEWPSRAVRNEYFLDLHMRVVRVQHEILQELLNSDENLMQKFIVEWRKRDYESFLLLQDPEFDEWFSEDSFEVGEGEEKIVFEKTENFPKTIKP